MLQKKMNFMMMTAIAALTLGAAASASEVKLEKGDVVHTEKHAEPVKVLKSTPGDVKTSNDDSGMSGDVTAHGEGHPAAANPTPGDVKTSNDDRGESGEVMAHDKVIENGHPAK